MNTSMTILAIMVIYLVIVIITGVIIGKNKDQSKEWFFLGGRKMGPLVTAM